MTFHDFVIDTRLEKYNEQDASFEVPGLDGLGERSKEVFSQFGSRYLDKKRILEREGIDHDPSRKQFFHEFPRKQSNNDLEYHTDDIVVNFLVHWFFMKRESTPMTRQSSSTSTTSTSTTSTSTTSTSSS